VAAAPSVAFFAVPSAAPSVPAIAECPLGETEDLFTGTDQCIPEIAPNVSGGNWPTPTPVPPPGGLSYSTPGDPNSIPEINGVPCTGHNAGECIGLEEDQVPDVVPHSSLSSSP
jgi:hypothetical protein